MGEHRRSPLRILAPAAVVAFGLATILVIASTSSSGGGTGGGGSTRLEQQDLGAKKHSGRTTTGDRLPEGTYIVKRNDTFGSIAAKTGVPVDKLLELNPDLDPQTLHAGQKIKLR
jgi:LysM repeat protein